MKQKALKITGLILSIIILAVNYSLPMQRLIKTGNSLYYSSQKQLSNAIDSINCEFLSFNSEKEASAIKDESLTDHQITAKLFGVIPIKTISCVKKNEIILMPSGQCVGINIDLNGLIVVGMSQVIVDNRDNKVDSPAQVAGIKTGDYILEANGHKTVTTDVLEQACDNCKGKLKLKISRNGKILFINVEPAYDNRSHSYKLGAWVREDTAGIGTVSFYDPLTNGFAALGHAVTDIDTGDVFDVTNGSIRDCTIISIAKGKNGTPGELAGAFSSSSKKYGSITANNDFGIYGTLNNSDNLNVLYPDGIQLAYPDEVNTGEATMLCSLDGDNINEYTCKIIKKTNQDSPSIKSLVVEITDTALITKTGGIVQGMSGSPIIQNNKLIGVVTHVMINNPRRGYGILAYWMYDKLLQG